MAIAFEAVARQKPGIGGVQVYSRPGFLLWEDCACVAAGYFKLSGCFADHVITLTGAREQASSDKSHEQRLPSAQRSPNNGPTVCG